jgi:hypothetical protein
MPFPRHWTFSYAANPGGDQAVISVPGAPGVTHVLEAITASLVSVSATTFGPTLVVFANGPGGTQLLAWNALVASPTAGSVDTAEFSVSGLELAPLPGQSLWVGYNAVTIAGTLQNLIIQGRDE